MAKKREEEVKQGLPAWMGTYGDMITLLLCFFVLLFSMSSVDVRKFQEALSSFKNQIDVLPGGVALTDGERINNGVTQMTDIEILVQRALEKTEGVVEDDPSKSNEEPTPEELEEMMMAQAEEVAEDVAQALAEEGYRDDVNIQYSLNFVKITLPGEALFDSARADIKPEAFPVIDVISELINSTDYSDYNVQIEGHTDDVPINTVQFPSNWELSSARAISIGKYLVEDRGFDPEKMAWSGYGEFRPIAPNDTPENRALNRRVEVKIVLQTEEIDVVDYDESQIDADGESTDTTETSNP